MATVSTERPALRRGASVTAAGLWSGIGMGGFVDGIVLHQVLQWHQMLSTTERFGPETLENVKANVVADGLFHTATWLCVAVGLAALWRLSRDGVGSRTWRSLVGWMLVGWGAFNLVEGLVDHHLLQIHRVRPEAANPLAWDLAFLVLGAVLVVFGWLLQRRDV